MDFYSEKIVKVRKPRNCDGCGKMLEKGEAALTYSGKFNGDFGSNTLHTDCREAELAYNKMADTNWDEFVGLHELEADDWDWLLADFPTVAARLNVTPERISEHKAEQKRMWDYRMEEAKKRETERKALIYNRAILSKLEAK